MWYDTHIFNKANGISTIEEMVLIWGIFAVFWGAKTIPSIMVSPLHIFFLHKFFKFLINFYNVPLFCVICFAAHTTIFLDIFQYCSQSVNILFQFSKTFFHGQIHILECIVININNLLYYISMKLQIFFYPVLIFYICFN